LLAHWYGWTLEEILNLTPDDFSAFLLAIDVLESRQVLRACTAADWPNLKSQDRARTLRYLQKSANPVATRAKKLSTKDLAEMAGVMSGR
jgi:predicted DNA-binding transcriptional regulator YafY